MFAVIRIFKSAVDALLSSPPSPFFSYLQLGYFACAASFFKLASSSQDTAMCYTMHCPSAVKADWTVDSTKFRYHLWQGDREGGKEFGH